MMIFVVHPYLHDGYDLRIPCELGQRRALLCGTGGHEAERT
jgi:hypothetical protein